MSEQSFNDNITSPKIPTSFQSPGMPVNDNLRGTYPNSSNSAYYNAMGDLISDFTSGVVETTGFLGSVVKNNPKLTATVAAGLIGIGALNYVHSKDQQEQYKEMPFMSKIGVKLGISKIPDTRLSSTVRTVSATTDKISKLYNYVDGKRREFTRFMPLGSSRFD